jgi:3-keto-5-aminohexanoate cleavage enzyme
LFGYNILDICLQARLLHRSGTSHEVGPSLHVALLWDLSLGKDGTTGGLVEQPAIIEAAINGITSKDQNPNVPRLPAEIADDALRCLAGGASIVHNHVDVVMVDGPTAAARYLECWRPIWEKVPGALLYPTVNAGPVEQSFAHLPLLAAAGCRIGIVDSGSVNLGGFVYVNSRSDIDHQLRVCVDNQLGPSLAIFEPGFLRIALRLWKEDRLPAGTMIKLYFGGEVGYLGVVPTDLADRVHP